MLINKQVVHIIIFLQNNIPVSNNSLISVSDTKNGEDGLPRAKRVLFSLDSVQLGWHGSWSAGAGMQNVGNTCYLNSTLQALFHVPALANWLITELAHSDKCNQQG